MSEEMKMSELKSCELCGTKTSGNKDERFNEYQKRLIKSAKVARDERALVFIASDQIGKLDSLSSSARRLLHEQDIDDADYYFPAGRYAHPEAAKERIQLAIKCLSMALDSIDKHLECK